ncbi:MAG TPA: hypothetical protein VFZ52_20875, partial [Chryseolinea sp.]
QPLTADRGDSGTNPSILPTLGGESEKHVQCATPSAMRSATLKNSQGQQLENANYTGTKLKQRENR